MAGAQCQPPNRFTAMQVATLQRSFVVSCFPFENETIHDPQGGMAKTADTRQPAEVEHKKEGKAGDTTDSDNRWKLDSDAKLVARANALVDGGCQVRIRE